LIPLAVGLFVQSCNRSKLNQLGAPTDFVFHEQLA